MSQKIKRKNKEEKETKKDFRIDSNNWMIKFLFDYIFFIH